MFRNPRKLQEEFEMKYRYNRIPLPRIKKFRGWRAKSREEPVVREFGISHYSRVSWVPLVIFCWSNSDKDI